MTYDQKHPVWVSNRKRLCLTSSPEPTAVGAVSRCRGSRHESAVAQPTTVKQWVAYIVVFLLIQPCTMYLCLRVLHWNFFLFAFLAAALAVGGAVLAVTVLSTRSMR